MRKWAHSGHALQVELKEPDDDLDMAGEGGSVVTPRCLALNKNSGGRWV